MKKSWMIGGIAVIAAAIAVSIIFNVNADHTPPVIYMADIGIEYKEGQDEAILLAGITAADDKDGNVTDSLTVETIVPMVGGERAIVYIVAKDKHNNIARAQRTVRYEALTKEVVNEADSQTQPETDAAPQETGNAPQETTAASQNNTAATAKANETETTTANSNPAAPVVKLADDETTIAAGGTFAVYRYVDSVSDDKDTSEDLFKRLQISGTYNTQNAGDYPISIYAVDSDGNRSNMCSFVLHVR